MQEEFLENEAKNPFSRSKAPTGDFYVGFDKNIIYKLVNKI